MGKFSSLTYTMPLPKIWWCSFNARFYAAEDPISSSLHILSEPFSGTKTKLIVSAICVSSSFKLVNECPQRCIDGKEIWWAPCCCFFTEGYTVYKTIEALLLKIRKRRKAENWGSATMVLWILSHQGFAFLLFYCIHLKRHDDVFVQVVRSVRCRVIDEHRSDFVAEAINSIQPWDEVKYIVETIQKKYKWFVQKLLKFILLMIEVSLSLKWLMSRF